MTPSPFQKGVICKKKEFLPIGSICFPFKIDEFSEGRQKNYDKVTSPESVVIPLKCESGRRFTRSEVSEAHLDRVICHSA